MLGHAALGSHTYGGLQTSSPPAIPVLFRGVHFNADKLMVAGLAVRLLLSPGLSKSNLLFNEARFSKQTLKTATFRKGVLKLQQPGAANSEIEPRIKK